MMPAIPQPEITRDLFKRYYSEPGGDSAEGVVSSHWERLSDGFHVHVGPDGQPTRLDGGEGLGDMRWPASRHRALDFLMQRYMRAFDGAPPGAGRTMRHVRSICRALSFDPTAEAFRQSCTAAVVRAHLDARGFRGTRRFLMIGDGRGLLGLLFKSIYPDARVCFVDIGRTLLFTSYYAQRVFPKAHHVLATGARGDADADFLYCPADELSMLEASRFDVAVSVAAMQEMTPLMVSRYFAYMRGHMADRNLFYCISRESKRLVGGEVSSFQEYPWGPRDEFLVDGECPWYRLFLSREPGRPGPKVAGMRVPFVRYLDGRVLHRLAILATERSPPPESGLSQ